ncbi:TM2 domain-containing protein [Candidatus Saccharibacteria bacterium]|nr:TM2 domain-containing protein [Candidatus Saccharibacteria bacterium]
MSITLEISGRIFKLSSNRGTVLKINAHDFKIGMEDGTVLTIPRTEMKDPDFDVEDEVEIFKDGREFIIRVVERANRETVKARSRRKVDKNLFVWVGTFLFGWLGVDRFMRGQVFFGVLKIFIGPYTLFLWNIIDFFVAFSKAYGSAYGDKSEITFDRDGNYTR